MLRWGAVAHDECGAAVSLCRVVRAEPLDGKAAPGGASDDLALVLAGRQFQQRVQPRCDAAHAHLRDATLQRSDQPVPPTPVGEPRAAHVSVVGAPGDELGQGELIEHAVVSASQRLGRDDVVHELGREHQLPQP